MRGFFVLSGVFVITQDLGLASGAGGIPCRDLYVVFGGCTYDECRRLKVGGLVWSDESHCLVLIILPVADCLINVQPPVAVLDENLGRSLQGTWACKNSRGLWLNVLGDQVCLVRLINDADSLFSIGTPDEHCVTC